MNLDEIKQLIEHFNESSLTELKLEQNDTSLVLKRRSESNPVYTQPIMVHPQTVGAPPQMVADPALAAAAAGQAAAATPPAAGDPAGEATAGVEVITSPIVGTFYRSPSPDSPPFCQEGSVVEKGNPICILEAMKVMNELEAEFSMEIVAFKANNGDMVEYGTPLVEVRRV
mgnify:CR=1 FL=1